jgi:hypothetical protein
LIQRSIHRLHRLRRPRRLHRLPRPRRLHRLQAMRVGCLLSCACGCDLDRVRVNALCV